MAHYKNWLRRVLDISHGDTSARSAEERIVGNGPKLAINLGIDFGTSFTKVVYRDLGSEQSGLITFGGNTAESSMIPSVVLIDDSGDLSLDETSRPSDCIRVAYLKMRLIGEPNLPILPTIRGASLEAPEMTKALCSWFLSKVITKAQQHLISHKADLVKGRTIEWTANVGLPVEHYDSPHVMIFREVVAVAWAWADHGVTPSTLKELLSTYRTSRFQLCIERSNCLVTPEIAAAVYAFVTSRSAQYGIYVYFDVGGGTLDGVAFLFTDNDGEKRINFYSGMVRSLGVALICSQIEPASSGALERKLLGGGSMNSELASKLEPFEPPIRQLVASVIIEAKRKYPDAWSFATTQPGIGGRKLRHKRSPEDLKPLPVFLGGGGAGASWYRHVIKSTHALHNHLNAGIPRYHLRQVPMPPSFSMEGIDVRTFGRFAVAFGLAIPPGQGPDIGLPSQCPGATLGPVRNRSVVDYADTKDAYD